MENKGLLFIPDISGFTRFVNEIEIEHSRMVIQEILEILVDANQIGLEVSEIEGDAILFYKYGDPPALEEIYKQVERMFCEFHRNRISYDFERYCQCQACVSAVNLSLKVITHYGEFTGYNVKTFNKLIGKDIIVAHQLLKNDIDQHEYWLVTNSLLHDAPPADFTDWMTWQNSTKQTESGEIPFVYTQLSQLKNKLSQEPPQQFDFSKKVKVLSLSKEYDTDIITMFHASGDFNHRARWQEGVKKVEEVSHLLPRIGMRCKSIMENGEVTTYASSYYYQDHRIEFSETNEKNNRSTYYTLEKIDDKKTKLTIDFYMDKNLPAQISFQLFEKRKLETTFQKSMENLVELVKVIRF